MAIGATCWYLRRMRLRVLYHGNCFDGCSSAGVFARFYRERVAKAPVEVVYRPLEHKGSGAAVLARTASTATRTRASTFATRRTRA